MLFFLHGVKVQEHVVHCVHIPDIRLTANHHQQTGVASSGEGIIFWAKGTLSPTQAATAALAN